MEFTSRGLIGLGLLALAVPGALIWACTGPDANPGTPGLPVADAGGGVRDGPLGEVGVGSDSAADRWHVATNDAGCPAFVADVHIDPFPQRHWTGCGPGCRLAPAALEMPGIVAANASVAARYSSDDLYLAFDFGLNSAGEMVQVVRMSDERTVSAVKLTGSDCTFGGGPADAVFLVTPFVVPQPGKPLFWFGRMPRSPDETTVWQDAWMPFVGYAGNRIWLSDAHGLVSSTGAIGLLGSTHSYEFLYPDASDAPIVDTATSGNLLAIARSGATSGFIEGVDNNGQVRNLVTMPNGEFPIAVGANDTTLVWITATGSPAQVAEGAYATARLDWAPLNSSGIGAVVHGPNLATETRSVFRPLRVGDDFVGCVSCEPVGPSSPDPRCAAHIAQRSTGKTWRLGFRPGPNAFRNVLGVSKDEIFLSEVDYPTKPPFTVMSRIVGLQAGGLDALGW